jgi:phage terminase large subunit-like protein
MPENIDLVEYELERRKIFEPLRFFKPNAAQERFILAVANPKNTTILFPAGNWVGKTASAIALLGACIWPTQAEDTVFNDKLFKAWESLGYPKRARIVSTPKELENIGSIQTEVKKWWPAGKFTSDKKGKQFPSEFRTNTGWVIDLMSYEQQESEFEGATIPFFVFNEPPPEKIYNACIARMKFGGKILMPMTPLADSAWIYDRLVAHDGTKGIKVIYGDTEDNCREHSKNGVLPHSAIQALSDSCDPDDREARLHGKFLHLAGQIFKTFNRDVHVIKDQPLDNFLSGTHIYQIVDPAIGKPFAVIWANVTATGIITVYDEYPHIEFQGAKDSNLTVKEYADLFKAIEGHYKPDERILDRHFGNQRRTTGGLTLKQEFDEQGIEFQDSYSIGDSSSEVETGILKVKDLLRYNTAKPIDNINRPRLQVFESCTNTIHSLERWGRNPKTGKPKEEYKDFADCFRYLAMTDPEIVQERPWELKDRTYGVNR